MEKEEKEKIEGEGAKGAEGKPPEVSKGKRGLIKWAIIGAAVLMIAGGGFFGWRIFSKKGGGDSGHQSAASSTEGEDKGKEKGKDDSLSHIVSLDPFVVNLADPAEIRYLKITINLGVDSEKTSEDVQTRMPQIRDALLMLLTSKTSEDVKDIGGKLKLQDEMIVRVNNFLTEGKVKGVYFTEFVMQ